MDDDLIYENGAPVACQERHPVYFGSRPVAPQQPAPQCSPAGSITAGAAAVGVL